MVISCDKYHIGIFAAALVLMVLMTILCFPAQVYGQNVPVSAPPYTLIPPSAPSITEYFENLDWMIIGFILAGIVVMVLLVVLLSRPKSGKAGKQGHTGAYQHMGGTPPVSCMRCGAMVFDGRPFCGNCGSPLYDNMAQQPYPPQQYVPCPRCGMLNPHGVYACGNCNLPLYDDYPSQSLQPHQPPPLQQAFACPTCGAMVSFGMDSCANCGTRLTWR